MTKKRNKPKVYVTLEDGQKEYIQKNFGNLSKWIQKQIAAVMGTNEVSKTKSD